MLWARAANRARFEDSYLEFAWSPEESLIELLGECPSTGLDPPNSAVTTLEISFNEIKEKCPLAGDILSFVSLLDQQDIPKDFLPRQTATSVQFEKALGILQGYSMITASLDV